ncbi:MAG: hypothetical protein M3P40_07585, partial [Actinomycetota bacterium]|nr:hypothetical protein [Actinomycetota bacterium]
MSEILASAFLRLLTQVADSLEPELEVRRCHDSFIGISALNLKSGCVLISARSVIARFRPDGRELERRLWR